MEDSERRQRRSTDNLGYEYAERPSAALAGMYEGIRRQHARGKKEYNNDLLSNFTKIAGLAVQASSNEFGKDSTFALKILRETHAVTWPWLDGVAEELKHHGLHDEPNGRGRRRRTKHERSPEGLAAFLAKLAAMAWKAWRTSKNGGKHPWKLTMLKEMHDLLDAHLRDAEREIKKLERKLEGKHRRHRHRHRDINESRPSNAYLGSHAEPLKHNPPTPVNRAPYTRDGSEGLVQHPAEWEDSQAPAPRRSHYRRGEWKPERQRSVVPGPERQTPAPVMNHAGSHTASSATVLPVHRNNHTQSPLSSPISVATVHRQWVANQHWIDGNQSPPIETRGSPPGPTKLGSHIASDQQHFHQPEVPNNPQCDGGGNVPSPEQSGSHESRSNSGRREYDTTRNGRRKEKTSPQSPSPLVPELERQKPASPEGQANSRTASFATAGPVRSNGPIQRPPSRRTWVATVCQQCADAILPLPTEARGQSAESTAQDFYSANSQQHSPQIDNAHTRSTVGTDRVHSNHHQSARNPTRPKGVSQDLASNRNTGTTASQQRVDGDLLPPTGNYRQSSGSTERDPHISSGQSFRHPEAVHSPFGVDGGIHASPEQHMSDEPHQGSWRQGHDAGPRTEQEGNAISQSLTPDAQTGYAYEDLSGTTPYNNPQSATTPRAPSTANESQSSRQTRAPTVSSTESVQATVNPPLAPDLYSRPHGPPPDRSPPASNDPPAWNGAARAMSHFRPWIFRGQRAARSR